MTKAKYRELKNYKYQVVNNDYSFETNIKGRNIATEYIILQEDGTLTTKKGYAWDGATGLPIELESIVRGSLAHDAMYQLLRGGHFGYLSTRNGKTHAETREKADKLLVDICKQDGMGALSRTLMYKGLRIFGANAAKIRRRVTKDIIHEFKG